MVEGTGHFGRVGTTLSTVNNRAEIDSMPK